MTQTLRTGSQGFDVALLQLQLNVRNPPAASLYEEPMRTYRVFERM